uniref:Uncharacterized protein n=1 Tax=Cacopsylla melanoneura TaxID=428564 RepID=A0A8D8WAQ7_9HEMI
MKLDGTTVCIYQGEIHLNKIENSSSSSPFPAQAASGVIVSSQFSPHSPLGPNMETSQSTFSKTLPTRNNLTSSKSIYFSLSSLSNGLAGVRMLTSTISTLPRVLKASVRIRM